MKIINGLRVAGHWMLGFYLITASIALGLNLKERFFPPISDSVTVTIPGETFIEQVAQSQYVFEQDEKGNCSLRLRLKK